MWLFFTYNDGYIPYGNDGQMKIPARCSNKRIRELARTLKGNRAGRVYLMRDWTQQMCELGPNEFELYIMRNGQYIDLA